MIDSPRMSEAGFTARDGSADPEGIHKLPDGRDVMALPPFAVIATVLIPLVLLSACGPEEPCRCGPRPPLTSASHQ